MSNSVLTPAILAILLPISALAGASEKKFDHHIELTSIEFHPSRLKIKAGETIKFTNQDPFNHDIYIVRMANRNFVVVPATAIPSKGVRYVTLKEGGVFNLYCTIHGGMDGKITTTESFKPSAKEVAKYEKAKAPLPAIVGEGKKLFWAKAQCFQCHKVGSQGKGTRGPNLQDIGFRARVRARKVGLTSATDYIVQSILEPSAVIVEGYTDDMATVYQPPINLSAAEIKKVVTYLQSLGGEVDVWAIDINRGKLKRKLTLNPFKHGDPGRGAKMFKKTGCFTCHKVGPDKTTMPGPDLSEIGAFRHWTWLAESILTPSAEVGANWKSVEVFLDDGTSEVGTLKKNSSKEVVILTDKLETIVIPKDEVEEVKIHKLSRMPSNFKDILTFQQVADIIAYLQSLKGQQKRTAKP